MEAVLAELEQLRRKNAFVFFVDDNLVANRRYALSLFDAMRGMGFQMAFSLPHRFRP